MNTIVCKILNRPRKKSRQLLFDLLHEHPSEKQQEVTLSNPLETPIQTSQVPQPLLIASSFQFNQELFNLTEEENEKEIAKNELIRRRSTPYLNHSYTIESEYQYKDQESNHMREINELKKIVKLQKKQLNYLLSRSFEPYVDYHLQPSYYPDDYTTHLKETLYNKENQNSFRSEHQNDGSISIPNKKLKQNPNQYYPQEYYTHYSHYSTPNLVQPYYYPSFSNPSHSYQNHYYFDQ